jgi:hypothetical protein
MAVKEMIPAWITEQEKVTMQALNDAEDKRWEGVQGRVLGNKNVTDPNLRNKICEAIGGSPASICIVGEHARAGSDESTRNVVFINRPDSTAVASTMPGSVRVITVSNVCECPPKHVLETRFSGVKQRDTESRGYANEDASYSSYGDDKSGYSSHSSYTRSRSSSSSSSKKDKKKKKKKNKKKKGKRGKRSIRRERVRIDEGGIVTYRPAVDETRESLLQDALVDSRMSFVDIEPDQVDPYKDSEDADDQSERRHVVVFDKSHQHGVFPHLNNTETINQQLTPEVLDKAYVLSQIRTRRHLYAMLSHLFKGAEGKFVVETGETVDLGRGFFYKNDNPAVVLAKVDNYNMIGFPEVVNGHHIVNSEVCRLLFGPKNEHESDDFYVMHNDSVNPMCSSVDMLIVNTNPTLGPLLYAHDTSSGSRSLFTNTATLNTLTSIVKKTCEISDVVSDPEYKLAQTLHSADKNFSLVGAGAAKEQKDMLNYRLHKGTYEKVTPMDIDMRLQKQKIDTSFNGKFKRLDTRLISILTGFCYKHDANFMSLYSVQGLPF